MSYLDIEIKSNFREFAPGSDSPLFFFFSLRYKRLLFVNSTPSWQVGIHHPLDR